MTMGEKLPVSLATAVYAPTVKEFWTPEELAEELGISVAVVAHWRSRGGGPPFIKVGRTVRYPVVAVRVWTLQHAKTTTSKAGTL